MADKKQPNQAKPVVGKPLVTPPFAAPAVEPSPAPAPAEPATAPAAIAAAPVAVADLPIQAAEASRAVAEEAKAAVEKAADTVSRPLAAAPSAPYPNPLKGYLNMATSFNPQSFAPNADAMKSMFGDMQSRAQGSVDKGVKLVEEMSEFAKGNVEAMVASGRVAAKGAETMGQEAAEYGKKSLESATAALKSFATAKSPTELLKLQSDYARASFDAAVAEGSKLTEAWLKLAGEIAQPLSSRVAVAAEKIKAPVAA